MLLRPASFLSVGFAATMVASVASAGVITDFESGTTEGWTAADGTVALSVVAGGSGGSGFALQVTRTGGSWNNTMSLILSAPQWADVTANTRLSLDVRAQGGTDVPGWWLQAFPVINSQAGGWDQAGDYVGGTLDGQWHTYTWDYPSQPLVPGNSSDLWLASQGGAGPNMTFFVDNIRVSVVPEPASLALLGLGAACALSRRRAG